MNDTIVTYLDGSTEVFLRTSQLDVELYLQCTNVQYQSAKPYNDVIVEA